MTKEALHPDQLTPGDRVGAWHIVQVLGRGGSSRVFKVERDGRPYSLKMALRPLTDATGGAPRGGGGGGEECMAAAGARGGGPLHLCLPPQPAARVRGGLLAQPQQGLPLPGHRFRGRGQLAPVALAQAPSRRRAGGYLLRGGAHRGGVARARRVPPRLEGGQSPHPPRGWQALPHRLRHCSPAGSAHDDAGHSRGCAAPVAARAPGLHPHRGVEAGRALPWRRGRGPVRPGSPALRGPHGPAPLRPRASRRGAGGRHRHRPPCRAPSSQPPGAAFPQRHRPEAAGEEARGSLPRHRGAAPGIGEGR